MLRLPSLARRVLVVTVVMPLTLLVALELLARALGPERLGADPERIRALSAAWAGESTKFAPYPYVGYVPVWFYGDGPTRPRDWAFELEDSPRRPRIACIGGSTTFGDYPKYLRAFLVERLGQEVDVMNWGCPGWSSQETLVNYVVNVQDYRPDVVVFLHAVNDVLPRLVTGYRPDFGHYRKGWDPPPVPWVDRLGRHSLLWLVFRERSGLRIPDLNDFTVQQRFGGWERLAELPEGTTQAFERNVRTLAELTAAQGTTLVLLTQPQQPAFAGSPVWIQATREHNEILRRLGRELGLLVVDCEASLAPQEGSGPALFHDLVHLTRKGQLLQAEEVGQALLDAGAFERWSLPEATRAAEVDAAAGH